MAQERAFSNPHAMGLQRKFRVGTPEDFVIERRPDVPLRPRHVITNVGGPGIVILRSIHIGNIEWLIGGQYDAFSFASQGGNAQMDIPACLPSTACRIRGRYTGAAPKGFEPGMPFTFVLSIRGPGDYTRTFQSRQVHCFA